MRRLQVILMLLGAISALMVISLAPPALAVDDVVTVDFESAPPAIGQPVSDEYLASSFVSFVYPNVARPYRLSSALATSGTVVANIGANLCALEFPPGNGCESYVGGTTGVLSRTASSVSVRAGLFEPPNDPVTLHIEAYDANNVLVTTGAKVPLTTGAFTAQASVSRPAADIARFRVVIDSVGNGKVGAQVGFDDLTLSYPQGSLPDVGLSTGPNTVAVQQGASVDVPLTISRINGSNGPLDLGATGLPLGVTAQFLPDPVPGTGSTATMRLTAAPDAPQSQLGIPQTVTITGDPLGAAAVAPAPRSTTVPVRVASPYTLVAAGTTAPRIPTCSSVDVPLRLERDRAFGGTVTLETSGLPAGVTASFPGGSTIAPGGGFFVDVILRLTGPATTIPATRMFVHASSPGVETRFLGLDLATAPGSATVAAPTSLRLTAPQVLRPGTEVRVTGNGFCPGTMVRVGTSAGAAPATVEDEGRALRFVTPRLATSGTVTIVPPLGSPYPAANPVDVATYRSTNGLSFGNYDFTGLSLSEAADTFGYDELFMKVNPCWPWSSCPVITPIPDPTAFVAYGIIDQAMQDTGGHCFGISRAVQQWTTNHATLNRWTSGNVFSIPGRTGALDSFLDGQHATQASAEFIRAFFTRSQTIAGNLAVIRDTLASGEVPLVSVRFGDKGHAMIAYDVIDRPDGGVDVLLYDNNVPFAAGELTDANTHIARETVRSVLKISPDRTRWDFDNGEPWTGGGDKLFAVRRNVIPDNPSLPGGYQLLEGLAYLVFGSGDGAVRTDASSTGADYLPLLDSSAPEGAGGVVGGRDGRPLSHTVRGVKKGRYRQAVVTEDGIAAVDVATAPGVRDVTGATSAGGLTFTALGRSARRRLKIDLARKPGATSSRRATITTTTGGGAKATARMTRGGTITYAHDGPATTYSLTLQSVQTNGGPASFTSGPLRVERGESVTVRPASWRSLGSVRVTTRTGGGRARTRTVRNRSKPPASLAVRSLRLSGRRVVTTVRATRLPRVAALGVVLRMTRGGRTVARRAFKVQALRAGTRTLRWTLPRSVARGSYRLVANATVAVSGARTGTVRRARSTRVRVR